MNRRPVEFELSPYTFPDTVEELRACEIGTKVMDVYGVIQPFFDLADDEDTEMALGIVRKSEIITAHRPHDPEDVYGFISHTSFANYPEEVSIPYLSVYRFARQRGIGQTLLRTVEDIAEARGAWQIDLRATPSSRPFYERQGYELVDARELMMQLRLPR